MKDNITNDGKNGGLLVGKPHFDRYGKAIGGIKAIVKSTNNIVELQGGEAIINAESVKKNWKELSKINQSAGNGVPILNPNVVNTQFKFSKGGNIQNITTDNLKKISDLVGGKLWQKSELTRIYVTGGNNYHYDGKWYYEIYPDGKWDSKVYLLQGYNNEKREEYVNKYLSIMDEQIEDAIKELNGIDTVAENKPIEDTNTTEIISTPMPLYKEGDVLILNNNTSGYYVTEVINKDNVFYYKGYFLDEPEETFVLLESSFNSIEPKIEEQLPPPKIKTLKERTKIEKTAENFTEIRQALDEFFTPHWLAEIMFDLALKYGFKGGNILEPSFGGGVFFDVAMENVNRIENGITERNLWGFELYQPNYELVKKKYPKANLFNHNFEYQFIEKDLFYKRNNIEKSLEFADTKFDLVIGNPPYGNHKSPHSYYFDNKLQVRYEGFFIYLALQKLKKDGLLVFIINSLWLNNGETYNKQKEEIAKLGDLIDAYRLPNKLFADTDIATDIVVFKRK